MFTTSVLSLAILVGSAAAKICKNLTIPLEVSARNAVFNIDVPSGSLDPTTFIQNVTQQGRNFTDIALTGYATVSGSYNLSAQFCQPSTSKKVNTLQILTHGIGFDKTYWDTAYNNFNYSYVNVATDTYGYSTIAIDRLGIGQSSHGEPLNEIQSFLEVAALAELTTQLRAGAIPGISTFDKYVHVGHSFGSAQTYALANLYPTLTDGIVLTGFSTNGSFVPFFAAGADFQLANLNQPFRFGNVSDDVGAQVTKAASAFSESTLNAYGLTDYLAGLTPGTGPRVAYGDGYLTNSNANANQYLFFLPGFFDTGLLFAGEATKQPVTVGEILTLPSIPMVNNFAGPVLVITGSNDLPYCGGDCLNTGDPAIPSIPSTVIKSFPHVPATDFEAYIQPNTGHGINFHYNATGAYDVIQNFLGSKGM